MPLKDQKSPFDPVILVALGIGLLTLAIVLYAFQSQAGEEF